MPMSKWCHRYHCSLLALSLQVVHGLIHNIEEMLAMVSCIVIVRHCYVIFSSEVQCELTQLTSAATVHTVNRD